MIKLRKIVYVFVFLFIIALIYYFLKDYSQFVRYKENISSGVFVDFKSAYLDFIENNDQQKDFITEDFVFFLSGSEVYGQIYDRAKDMSFGVRDYGDSLHIYEYGYNQKDNNGSNLYNPLEISYFRKFFVDGDVFILVIYDVEKAESKINDNYPPPPKYPPPPQ